MKTLSQKYHAMWSRARYAIDPTPILKRNARWTRRNHEARLTYWRERNARPEQIAKRKPWIKISDRPPVEAAQMREAKRLRAQRNSMKLKAYWKAYRAAHPEKTKAHNKANWHARRRWVIKTGSKLPLIRRFIATILARGFFKCYYCDGLFLNGSLHFDHIIPRAKGGTHTVENLCTSCKSCNQQKHSKSLEEWRKPGQQLLDL